MAQYNLLERQPYLDALDKSLREVAESGGRIALVSGEAGIGKTALVEHVIARVHGRTSDARYDGMGRCYLEFGGGAVAQVDVTFAAGEAPRGTLFGPDESLMAHKSAFGSDRVRRWFGRDWVPGE